MGRESTNGLMVVTTKVIGERTRSTDSESIIGLMAEATKAHG